MTTTLMPRPLALAKLLALGDLPRSELAVICGWPAEEFRQAVHAAQVGGLIRRFHHRHERWYTVKKICPRR